MTLAELPFNHVAEIRQLPGDYELAIRLLEQGFVPKTQLSVVHKAPFNGPIAIKLSGTKIAIKASVAAQIQVSQVS